MHPSPRKSPGPRMATTASLPVSLTTLSFTTFLNVRHMLGGIALGENDVVSPKPDYLSPHARRVQKQFHIERRAF